LDRRALCADPRPHAWSMCAACFCPCVSLSRATPLGRSRYQTSEFLNTPEFPTELPTYTHRVNYLCNARLSNSGSLPPPLARRLSLSLSLSLSPARQTPLAARSTRRRERKILEAVQVLTPPPLEFPEFRGSGGGHICTRARSRRCANKIDIVHFRSRVLPPPLASKSCPLPSEEGSS